MHRQKSGISQDIRGDVAVGVGSGILEWYNSNASGGDGSDGGGDGGDGGGGGGGGGGGEGPLPPPPPDKEGGERTRAPCTFMCLIYQDKYYYGSARPSLEILHTYEHLYLCKYNIRT
uniref:Uncharacterized protein n=1 Tax=Vespula pensylvanica TaxID=30213 RepID=A0A834JLW3_VESPE|nr:hypothetical protein H0235_017756 [Vespula pensylvanica]